MQEPQYFYPHFRKETKLNRFTVFVQSIDLFKSATLRVHLYSDIDSSYAYDTRIYKMDGEDYANWTSDDYIVSYVKRKLRDEYETITGRAVYNKLTERMKLK